VKRHGVALAETPYSMDTIQRSTLVTNPLDLGVASPDPVPSDDMLAPDAPIRLPSAPGSDEPIAKTLFPARVHLVFDGLHAWYIEQVQAWRSAERNRASVQVRDRARARMRAAADRFTTFWHATRDEFHVYASYRPLEHCILQSAGEPHLLAQVHVLHLPQLADLPAEFRSLGSSLLFSPVPLPPAMRQRIEVNSVCSP